MSQRFLDTHKVGAGFIEMEPESMTAAVEDEAAAGKAGILHRFIEHAADRLVMDMDTRPLAWEEKILFGSPGIHGADIVRKNGEGFFRQDGITLGTVLRLLNKDGAFGSVDIAAAEPAELTDPDSGGIEKGKLSPVLDARGGVDDGVHFRNGGDVGKDGVEPEERYLILIPVTL